jgi:hypothetical protein
VPPVAGGGANPGGPSAPDAPGQPPAFATAGQQLELCAQFCLACATDPSCPEEKLDEVDITIVEKLDVDQINTVMFMSENLHEALQPILKCRVTAQNMAAAAIITKENPDVKLGAYLGSSTDLAVDETLARQVELAAAFAEYKPIWWSPFQEATQRGWQVPIVDFSVAIHERPINLVMAKDGATTNLNTMMADIVYHVTLGYPDVWGMRNANLDISTLAFPQVKVWNTVSLENGDAEITLQPGFFAAGYGGILYPKVTMTMKQNVVIPLTDWGYEYYPFDQQTIPIKFYEPHGQMTKFDTCNEELLLVLPHKSEMSIFNFIAGEQNIANDEAAQVALIGGKGGVSSIYELNIDTEGGWLSTNTFAFFNQDASARSTQTHTCEIDIHVRRKPKMYMVKSFLEELVVVMVGVGALFLTDDPGNPLPTRVAVLMTSMLMTINMMVGRDLGLGQRDSFIAIDIMSIVNTLVTAIGLLITVAIHSVYRMRGEPSPGC